MRSSNPHHGVTLIEVTISTVLVAVVLVSSLETLSGSMRTLRASQEPVDAHTLLAVMAAEINSVPYEDPDGNSTGIGIEADEPAAPSDRLAFDDVDDFNDHLVSPPTYRDGTAVAGLDGWEQEFTVTYRDADGLATVTPIRIADDEGLVRYELKLESPDGRVYRRFGFRSRYGPMDEPAPFDATRVTSVAVEVQVGSAAPLVSGVPIHNLAEAP